MENKNKTKTLTTAVIESAGKQDVEPVAEAAAAAKAAAAAAAVLCDSWTLLSSLERVPCKLWKLSKEHVVADELVAILADAELGLCVIAVGNSNWPAGEFAVLEELSAAAAAGGVVDPDVAAFPCALVAGPLVIIVSGEVQDLLELANDFALIRLVVVVVVALLLLLLALGEGVDLLAIMLKALPTLILLLLQLRLLLLLLLFWLLLKFNSNFMASSRCSRSCCCCCCCCRVAAAAAASTAAIISMGCFACKPKAKKCC